MKLGFEMMKRMTIALLGAVLLSGCSDPVTVQVTYTATGAPASDVLVQRRRPVNRWEKITNPIAATYRPQRVAEAHWTDAQGQCMLNGAASEDVYDLVTTSVVPLTVVVGTNRIVLSPGTNLNLTAYHYWAWQSEGKWKINVAEAWQKWDTNKPNHTHGTRQPADGLPKPSR